MSSERDQYTFDNPVTRYDRVEPPVQHQPEPGVQADMTPVPDLGEETYRGLGRLVGRKALITGGDSGIGGAVAIAFAREGADVAIVHLPDEQRDADHVLEHVRAAGRTGVSIAADISEPAACRDLVARAVEELGGLDILVNNAGKQVMVEKVDDLSDEQFELTFRTNVFAPFWITKAALAHLPEGGTIINTASLEAYKPAPDRLDYAATKAAMNNLSKGLAQQLAPRGIRVNVVAPRAHLVGAAGQPGRVGRADEGVRRREHLPARRPARRDRARLRVPRLCGVELRLGRALNVNGGMVTP